MIIDRADVARFTFCAHDQTKLDLLGVGFSQVRTAILARPWRYEVKSVRWTDLMRIAFDQVNLITGDTH